MDLVTLTDSRLGLNQYPVRILEISEDESGLLDIFAEEFPWGTATATLYPVQTASGVSAESEVDPGMVNAPIIFEPNNRLAQYGGNEIWMAISGGNNLLASPPAFTDPTAWVPSSI